MFLVSKNSWSGVNAPPTPGLKKDAMARPRKAPEEKRTARLPGLRLTEAEALFVEQQAARAGLSVADYQRRRLLGQPVRAARPRIEGQYLTALNQIGVNLNQIARALNSGRSLPGDIVQITGELRAVLARIGRHYDA